jgi:ABC-type nitrate/sulfonate/bicarbonate transport system ATPase subunit
MNELKIENLDYSYKLSNGEELSVLKNINIEIKKGDFVVVLGESGCGKTTLLNLIAGFLFPSRGTIKIDNEIIKCPHHSRSFIFQEPTLLPWLNVKDNILFGCKIRNEKIEAVIKRFEKYIEILGLKNFVKSYPYELSHGMRQRVAFARALINKPEIILLDEPFTGLDMINRAKIQSELIRNWLIEHYAIVFVTHDIDEALSLGRKIILLGARPSTIEHIFELDLKYPRDLTNKQLFDLKYEIQRRFRQIYYSEVNNQWEKKIKLPDVLL